jgi:hypothetical protein
MAFVNLSPLVRSCLLGSLLVAACSRSTLSGSSGSYAGTAGNDGNGGNGGAPVGPQTQPVVACERDSNCNDNDDCTVDTCQNNWCNFAFAKNDHDGDGYAGWSCSSGNDCNDQDRNVNPGTYENCANDIDDNCNGLTDCEDPECYGMTGCDACSAYETNCEDDIDNDCDGRRDCADTECFGTSSCPCRTTETNCSDQVDEDCDGLLDCTDPSCSGTEACSCQKTENCSNNRDDDCDGLTDCLDVECKKNQACGCTTKETNCTDGNNEDCDSTIDCEDVDCVTTAECQCRQTTEDCFDGIDNNCNDLVDCRDPACKDNSACTCSGGTRKEDCTDDLDNDCDGLPDCMDPDCLSAAVCKSCLIAENCTDGTDNDCDGFIDCQDTECLGKAENCRTATEICNDLKDNDFDSYVDCADWDCRNADYCKIEHATCITAMTVTASGTYTGTTVGHPVDYVSSCGGHGSEAIFAIVLSAPSRVTVDTIGSNFDTALYMRTGVCAEGPEIACNDDAGKQDDSMYSYSKIELPLLYPGLYYLFVDGFAATDYGVDSGAYVANISIEPNPKENCDNGTDDDGDVYVDCADSDCRSQARCNCNAPKKATPEFGVLACTDGIDNDCDGLTDGADTDDCRAENYPTEFCNGKDDNGNNIVDDFACRCATDADCVSGEICYTLTVHACSLPCSNFVGSSDSGICPAIANGSVCSNSWDGGSGQCVYP